MVLFTPLSYTAVSLRHREFLAAALSMIIRMNTLSLQDEDGDKVPLTTTAVTMMKTMMSVARSTWYALFCFTYNELRRRGFLP
jgi:hypothetical protein